MSSVQCNPDATAAKNDGANSEMRLNFFDLRTVESFTTSVIVGGSENARSMLLHDLVSRPRSCCEHVILFTTKAVSFCASVADEVHYVADGENSAAEIVRALLVQPEHPPTALVFENVGDLSKLVDAQTARVLVKNGRHHNLTLFFSAPTIDAIGLLVGNNADYAFVLSDEASPTPSSYELRRLRSRFFGRIAARVFPAAYQRFTQDGGVMVRDRAQRDRNIDSQILCYRKDVDVSALAPVTKETSFLEHLSARGLPPSATTLKAAPQRKSLPLRAIVDKEYLQLRDMLLDVTEALEEGRHAFAAVLFSMVEGYAAKNRVAVDLSPLQRAIASHGV